LLRQIFVHRAGHCAFTPAETITALNALVQRLDTGHWEALDPGALNSAAAALGSSLNNFTPAFIQYQPAPFLRPFDLTGRPLDRVGRPGPAVPSGRAG
jgi:hypothetical protein